MLARKEILALPVYKLPYHPSTPTTSTIEEIIQLKMSSLLYLDSSLIE